MFRDVYDEKEVTTVKLDGDKEFTVIDPPKDPELERAFLYGFMSGIPSPHLPCETVLDYEKETRPEIKKAFEFGMYLAEQHVQWHSNCLAAYYNDEDKKPYN